MQGVHDLNGEADGGETSPPPAAPYEKTNSKSSLLVSVLVLSVIAAATLAAYSPVLFNFFNGDDYVHLTWLADAIHKHEMIWRNFYTSWLNGTTTKFYRPLISVFMVSDYAIWGVNGLGFRLTNLTFHLAATAFIYFIVSNLQETLLQKSSKPISAAETEGSVEIRSNILWPVAAASIFALYPLHPEAVSWITGRVDSVVTAFCTASFFFYIKWRRCGTLPYAILACGAMILGLLSKEMAITLPAVFAWADLVYGELWTKGQAQETSLLRRLTETIKRCAIRTSPFWLILAAYFVVRYFALGTFVGGYDDSLLFIANQQEFIRDWIHALTTMIVPINRSLMGSHHLLSKLWPIALAGSGILLALNLWTDERARRHTLFQLGWLALCLIPVYKLFNIAADLQGSRLAYLATVPVCILLAASMYPSEKWKKKSWFALSQILVLITVLALSGYLLWNNNLPWRAAGIETTKIQNELRSLFEKVDGDPQTLFLGLPDQIDGAYTCRNALDGMTKKPQLQRDIRNCLMVNAFEPILPFGFLKESIQANSKDILIYRWDSAQGKFLKVEVPNPDLGGIRSWSGEQLKSIVSIPEQKAKPGLNWVNHSSAEISTLQNSGEIEIDFGRLPCFSTDYIVLNATLEQPAAAETGMDLLYSNDMYPTFELRRRAHSSYRIGETQETLIFGLRGLPEWSLGGNTHKFRLLIPPRCKFLLNSLEVAPARFVSPAISFENSGYFGSKGYLHLGPSQASQTIDVSVRQVEGAKTFELELTRANLLFESQNGQTRSKVLWKLIEGNGKEGRITLDFKDFRSPGIYEMRAWALDEKGTICGAASDHIVLSVDPASK